MMFIPYVCCGDPDMKFTRAMVKKLAPYSSMIELGIPFSDPIADGKTIQAAANRALRNGANVDKIFSMAGRLRREGIRVPFVFMAYYNTAYAYGRENFLKKMKEVGIQGIIVPDLPFNEDIRFERMARRHGISIVNLIAPNTSSKRAVKILNGSNKGNHLFTYLVSAAGTTGAVKRISSSSLSFVRRIRNLAGKDRTLCVGFGVSSAEHARQFAGAGADGIIVGSKLIDIYSKYIGSGLRVDHRALDEVERFAADMSSSG